MRATGVLFGLMVCSGCIVQGQRTDGGLDRYNAGRGTTSGADEEPAVVGDRAVASANGRITMPDVFGMTREQAETLLHRSGLRGSIGYDNSLCEDSVVRGRIMELGMVCYQRPSAGTVQGE